MSTRSRSIRDDYLKNKFKEEAKKQNAIQKADQDLVKSVIKKESAIGKKTTKEQTHQNKVADRATKNQNKRGRGK